MNDLQQTLAEIEEFFERLQRKIREIETENRQMIQMAGVGLLVEVVAHELARSSENALDTLTTLHGKPIPQQIQGLLDALRSELKAISKRVRVLDPLSVSGRQRKEVFDIATLISDITDSHKVQFARHRVKLNIKKSEGQIRVRAVKGMIVQIFENLISNSLYWLDLRRRHEIDFKPCITIAINSNPLTITFEDNGRGVAVDHRDRIFRAFFSLKEKSKRRGLGLFIARDCVEYHNGTLALDDQVNHDTGRLHRFVLGLPNEVVVR